MWCSARSGKTYYYSAWFRYSASRMDAHSAKFQKDTLANYSLKTLDAPVCHSYLDQELAAQAFERIQTKRVYLWAESGRVGEGFNNLQEFIQWVVADFQKYKNVHKWVNGIAILIGEVGDKIPLEEWERSEKTQTRKKRRK